MFIYFFIDKELNFQIIVIFLHQGTPEFKNMLFLYMSINLLGIFK